METLNEKIDNAKKVYIVRSSDDGNLGVYTNKKRAWESIVGSYFCETKHDTKMTYSKLLKEFKKYSIVDFEIDLYDDNNKYYGVSTLQVEIFLLNV